MLGFVRVLGIRIDATFDTTLREEVDRSGNVFLGSSASDGAVVMVDLSRVLGIRIDSGRRFTGRLGLTSFSKAAELSEA